MTGDSQIMNGLSEMMVMHIHAVFNLHGHYN